MSTMLSPAPPTSTAARGTRRGWRPVIGWLLVVVLIVGAALLAMRVADATSVATRKGQDPDATGQTGMLALAEIVRDRGVEVQIVRSRTAAVAAIRDDTTLVMADPYSLSDEAVLTLLEPAERVVLLSASSRMLRLLDLGATGGTTAQALPASCDVPEFAEIGSIRPYAMYTPAAGVTGCFTDADGDAAVLVAERDGVRTTLLDGTRLLSNAYLTEDGNAALGLALLAQTDHVVWYVPSFGDSDIEGSSDPDLASLTPTWLTPAILLLFTAAIAAAVWRGRRFGPLVSETLPVTVRASETMHGRARLTAKAADSAHAAAAIRDGAQRRLARRLGLAERSSGGEVADAAADRLRVPRASVLDLLNGPLPQTDEFLVDMARRLTDLETAVDAAVRTERNTP